MANILKFPLKAVRDRAPAILKAPAEILIFTGVRYERLEAKAETRAKSPRKSGLTPETKSA
ncbi:MAG: hypothetical protein WAT78_10850 [Rhizobiaceae bacterium]